MNVVTVIWTDREEPDRYMSMRRTYLRLRLRLGPVAVNKSVTVSVTYTYEVTATVRELP